MAVHAGLTPGNVLLFPSPALTPTHVLPFLQQRTQWHDIVWKLCPHFASRPRTVRRHFPHTHSAPTPASVCRTNKPPPPTAAAQIVLPVPRPVGFSAADDYKMSLSFDHDRFLTPWLLVMGPKAPDVPMVHVSLVR